MMMALSSRRIQLGADDREKSQKSFPKETVVAVWWQYDDNDADKSVPEDTQWKVDEVSYY